MTALVISSCKKDDSPTPNSLTVLTGINLAVNYTIDGKALYVDSFLYTSAAGFNYSINRFQYYLTNVKLIKPDNAEILITSSHYFDAFEEATSTIAISNIPSGNYIGIKFNIGVDSSFNYWDSLPNTTENTNMLWPLLMGGGYHFLKFEGYYKDGLSDYGYAMHLGTNACNIPVVLSKNISVTPNNTLTLNMNMNINEWLKNPNTFDFNLDGNYIMGNAAAMGKITQNGHDVFSF